METSGDFSMKPLKNKACFPQTPSSQQPFTNETVMMYPSGLFEKSPRRQQPCHRAPLSRGQDGKKYPCCDDVRLGMCIQLDCGNQVSDWKTTASPLPDVHTLNSANATAVTIEMNCTKLSCYLLSN